MSVISHTTGISHCASIGQLDGLRHLVGTLSLSTDVYHEMQVGFEEG